MEERVAKYHLLSDSHFDKVNHKGFFKELEIMYNTDNKEVIVLFNTYYKVLNFRIQAMIENKGNHHLTTQQIHLIIDNLLKIPKTHKLIHPCQQRTRYSNILDWMTSAMDELKQQNSLPSVLAEQQQQIIVASLTELIELTRKECQQKSIILQIVLQYFIGTINSYWQMFSNASKEVTYEYERNALKIQKQYVSNIKCLQAENEQLRKDKQHRWRNMFMLIKDNRIHRKQNKKLIKIVEHEMEKNKGMAEQMIKLQLEGEKMKMKILAFEGSESNLETFVDANLALIELEKKIREYPKRSKKVLKNQLLKIEINQSKNLQDKIQFIIKAIEETGEILDQIYDDNVVWSNFSYNISTQTENKTEEKGVNTPIAKPNHAEIQTSPSELLQLDFVDTVYVRLLPQKKQKKDISRESKNVMFATTNNLGKSMRREGQSKSRHGSRKPDFKQFSLCESLKITIYQGRIFYISTYNSEIFNGKNICHLASTKKQQQGSSLRQSQKKKTRSNEVEVQTEPSNEESLPFISHSYAPIITNKINFNPKNTAQIQHYYFEKKMLKDNKFLEISQQTDFCYDPDRNRHQSRIKMSLNIDKSGDSLRSSTMRKKITKDRYFDSLQDTNRQDKQNNKSDIRFAIKKMIKKQEKDEMKKNYTQENEDKQLAILNGVKGTPSSYVYEESQKEIFLTPKEDGLQRYTKVTKPSSEEISEIMTPQVAPHKNSTTTLQSSTKQKYKAQIKRNQSSFNLPNQFKLLQSNRLSKLSLESLKHKRTATETVEGNDLTMQHGSTAGDGDQKILMKMKPLHMINEDMRENGDDKNTKNGYKGKDKAGGLPFSISKQGQLALKDIDFSRGIDKIMRSIDLRHSQIINSAYTFKSYLASYFKVLYGKQLYPNFINYLIQTSSSSAQVEQTIVCLNRLSNPKLPEAYSIDLFKTFVLTLHNLYQVSQSPLASKNRIDILRHMLSYYFSNEDALYFQKKMTSYNRHSFVSWFNCLELQVRKKVLSSELYRFLFELVIQSEDTFPYQFIEEITYFIGHQPETEKNKVQAKYTIGDKIVLHRFCCFCVKNQWTSILNIQTTAYEEYNSKIGKFDEQQSLKNIQDNQQILLNFKTLSKYFKYWLSLHKRYACGVNRYLLMIIQLNILEAKIKKSMPLSMDLRFLSLAYQGLKKKQIYAEIRQKDEAKRSHRNTTVD